MRLAHAADYSTGLYRVKGPSGPLALADRRPGAVHRRGEAARRERLGVPRDRQAVDVGEGGDRPGHRPGAGVAVEGDVGQPRRARHADHREEGVAADGVVLDHHAGDHLARGHSVDGDEAVDPRRAGVPPEGHVRHVGDRPGLRFDVEDGVADRADGVVLEEPLVAAHHRHELPPGVGAGVVVDTRRTRTPR